MSQKSKAISILTAPILLFFIYGAVMATIHQEANNNSLLADLSIGSGVDGIQTNQSFVGN